MKTNLQVAFVLLVLLLAACTDAGERKANDPGPQTTGTVHNTTLSLDGRTEGAAKQEWRRDNPGCDILAEARFGASLAISYECE